MKQIIFLMILCTQVAAIDLYEYNEIESFLHQHQTKSGELTAKILSHKQPLKVLNEWLLSDQSSLAKEYGLTQLLTYMSTMPPDSFYDHTLEFLAAYQPKATQLHSESSDTPEAIFKISSQANGVKNIWQMKRTQQLTQQIIQYSQTPWQDLLALTENKNTSFLGIKNAINDASMKDLSPIINNLLEENTWPVNSGTLVVTLSQKLNDAFFYQKALERLERTAAERLYRHLAEQGQWKLLIAPITGQANRSFVTSLLAQYQDGNPEVETFLIDQLSNPKTASGAAFALSQNQNPVVWQQLLDMAKDSDNKAVHQLIEFSLNSNLNARQWIKKVKQ